MNATNKQTQNFNFAKANGFSGSFEEYLQLNYKAYAAICKRCDTDPMAYGAWLATQ